MMTDHEKKVFLKPGRERSVLNNHPWIFSGAIERTPKQNLKCGDIVNIYSSSGNFLSTGAYSPTSQIRIRNWSYQPETIDAVFIEERIKRAINTRYNQHILEQSNAYRLIYAESDHLPGLIVDKYTDYLVVQFLSCSVEVWRDEIVDILRKNVSPKMIVERSDDEVRNLEGLPKQTGSLFGIPPDKPLEITEHKLKYLVNIQEGQKTGFFLDQRTNRLLVRGFVEDKDVLDCFCYTGGFSLNALASQTKSLTAIDSSEAALEMFRANLELNHFAVSDVEILQADAFLQLRKFRDENRSFDCIILDPPKFAPTRKQVEQAARGYKDINLLAFKLLRPGGILFTFSCSGGIDPGLFQKIVSGAANDANSDIVFLRKLSQDLDHPINASFPEGEYLKGLVCLKRS